ncbi:hypothetical protein ABT354_23045 [Streptomyces sp. NPDC000594]|uniref:hypothetical protein n=1 Tax=Streptomyces sp. NPDC000594 TaxID=3154261 RepID=UPI003317C41E
MGWARAKIKQVMGRKKEADGIALRNERLRKEGEREKQQGREEQAAWKEAARRRKQGH